MILANIWQICKNWRSKNGARMVNVIYIPKNRGRGRGGGNPFFRPVNQTIKYGLSPIPTDAKQLKSI